MIAKDQSESDHEKLRLKLYIRKEAPVEHSS
jgi:hypothetical protein